MSRQLFGTDGIRGIAGKPPLDPRTAFALGVALGAWATESKASQTHGHPEVIIGMDTRESGPWLAASVAEGLQRSGVKARFAGVITTPGVAYLAKTGEFIAGIMISASHNPYQDNGIKVINHAGFKLADEVELQIEQRMFAWLSSGEEAGEAALIVDPTLDNLYTDHLASTVTGSFPLPDCYRLCQRLRNPGGASPFRQTRRARHLGRGFSRRSQH